MSIEYFKSNQLASNVWSSKYALKDLDGNQLEEDPDDMHLRLTNEFVRIEKEKFELENFEQRKYEIYSLFKDFKYIIPQGSIMSGLGDKFRYKSLSNCIVLKDVVDSYGGICYSDQQLAQLMKRRCGIGIDISKLRPRGTNTKNAAVTSTGAVSFAKRFSNTTKEVAQEGRRGALMLTLHCKHPDVMEFIEAKNDTTTISGANISVKWTDEFFEALENNETFTLQWPVDVPVEEAEIIKEVDPFELLTRSAQMAHGYDIKAKENSTDFGGDPGCMFIDQMKSYAPDYGYPNVTVRSTNPCGEIGMDLDSCRLIALNFMGAVEQPFTDKAHINLSKVEELAYQQQVLLDDLVELEIEYMQRILNKVESDPEDDKFKQIEIQTWESLINSAKKYRRTGGGFTALGDMLASVGLEYGSSKGNETVDQVMRAKFKGEWQASIDLAKERGPFPEWNPEYDQGPFFDMMKNEFPDLYKQSMKYGRRNISLSTVAPTGSVSLLANINGKHGTTSGIEPVFSTEENVLWHTRNKKSQEGDEVDYIDDDGIEWTQYKVFYEGFKQWLINNRGYQDWENASKDLLVEYAKESPYITSAGLDVKDRIDLQAIVQKYTTHSISSTLNLPQDANWKETYNIYKYAYEAGLKGVTIFRNGSKRGVLESSDTDDNITGIEYRDAPKRPETLNADVHFVRDKWAVIIGLLNDKPYELFVMNGFNNNSIDGFANIKNTSVVKKDSREYVLNGTFNSTNYIYNINILDRSPSSDADVLTRFVSMLMRHGVKMEFIVEQVEKADISINDFSSVVVSVLKQYTDTNKLSCDDCGGESVAYVEGCYVCQECGSSRCG